MWGPSSAILIWFSEADGVFFCLFSEYRGGSMGGNETSDKDREGLIIKTCSVPKQT